MSFSRKKLIFSFMILFSAIAAIKVYSSRLANFNESLQDDYQLVLDASQLIISEEFKIISAVDNTMSQSQINTKLINDSVDIIGEKLQIIYKVIDQKNTIHSDKENQNMKLKLLLSNTFKMKKAQLKIIENIKKENTKNTKNTLTINNAVLKLHKYNLLPVLTKIALKRSLNYKKMIVEDKRTAFYLGIFIWILFILLLIMAYRLTKFNIVLEKKVINRTKSIKIKKYKIERLMNVNSLLIKHTHDGIIGLDPKGFITFLNPSALLLLGINDVSVYGLHINKLIEILNTDNKKISFENYKTKMFLDPSNAIKNSNCLFVLLESNKSIKVDFEITYYNSKEYHAEGFILNFRDISERNALESKLNQERAMSLNTAKLTSLGLMAGGIAHEINTPLGVIMISNEEIEGQLRSKNIDLDYALSLSETIKSTTLKVSRIITALKSLSHVSNKDVYSYNSIDQVVDSVLTLANEKIKFNKVDIIYNNSLGPNSEMYCDQVQISQVILNLISNSIDAVENLDDKWIKINISEEGSFIYLSIIDSGKGISENNLNKIFQPFFTTKPVGKGTGLGMSISKSIAVKHGGDIVYDKSSLETKIDLMLPKITRTTNNVA